MRTTSTVVLYVYFSYLNPNLLKVTVNPFLVCSTYEFFNIPAYGNNEIFLSINFTKTVRVKQMKIEYTVTSLCTVKL